MGRSAQCRESLAGPGPDHSPFRRSVQASPEKADRPDLCREIHHRLLSSAVEARQPATIRRVAYSMVLVACDLPHAVRVVSSLLGTSQLTAIEGVETQVHWPAVQIGLLDWPELIPPGVLNAAASPESWAPPPFQQWGTPSRLTSSQEVLAADVRRIVLAFSLDIGAGLPTDRHDAIRPITEWLAPRLHSWVSLFIEWLEVQTKQGGSPAARSRPEGTEPDPVSRTVSVG